MDWDRKLQFKKPAVSNWTWLRYVRVFAIANPSVCLSVVCLSVTLVHPTQWVEAFQGRGNTMSRCGRCHTNNITGMASMGLCHANISPTCDFLEEYRLKTWLRNTTGQKQLTHLSLMATNRSTLHSLDRNKTSLPQSNLGTGPRRCECLPRGGLWPACVAEAQFGPCAVGQCAVSFIHEYACHARQLAACVLFVVEQSLLFANLSKTRTLILKVTISPKRPRIDLSNDTFAEQKWCQVFAYESETFHRRRPNGIAHCENEEQTPPQTSPSPCTTWTPSNTAVSRPTAPTTSNRSYDGWGTVAHARRKVAIGYNGASQIRPQKYPFSCTDPKHHYLPHP